MHQLFRPRANAIARLLVAGIPFSIAVVALSLFAFARSDFWTEVGAPVEQPIPFSHQHHAGELGIDCRYCHTSAERSHFAGLPPTETCMTCHSQVWRDAPMLQPLRESWQTGQPIAWQRVYDLPGYVYFNHAMHVSNGVACASCHGAVNEMPLVWKTTPLYMRWCLDCHRQTPSHQLASGRQPQRQVALHRAALTDCYTCHR